MVQYEHGSEPTLFSKVSIRTKRVVASLAHGPIVTPCYLLLPIVTYSPQFTAEAAVDSVVEGSAMGGQANQFEGFTYQEDGVLG